MKKIGVIIALIIFNILAVQNVYAYDTGREVFVRHINRDTGDIIVNLANNTQEVIDSNGNQSLINNSTSDDAEIGYSEYYNYDVSSTMEITKSLVVKSGGKKYNYLGANICTMYSLDEAYQIMEQKKSSYRSGTGQLDIVYDNKSSTSKFVTKTSNSNDVTIIDFYYTEQNADSETPRLVSTTNVWNRDDSDETSNITYVPAGAMLKPYFITPKYVIKDLSYEKTIENGKVYYKVNNFNVRMINSSNLMSQAKSYSNNGINISGNLIGPTGDYIISNVDPTIRFKESTLQQVRDELANLLNSSKTTEIPSNNSLDNLDAGKTSVNDYVLNGFMVGYNKYNGLRSAQGEVEYVDYNVLTSSTGGTQKIASQNEHFFNLYTPIQLAVPEVTATNNTTINHSNTSSSTVILSDDASFEIKLSCIDSNFTYYNNVDDYLRADFVDYYYLIFDFDVIHNGRIYTKGTAIRMTNTARYNGGYTYFHGTVAPNETLSRDSSNHKIIVLAASSNMQSRDLLQYVVDQEVGIQIDKNIDVSQRKYLNDSGNNEVSFINDVDSVVSYSDPQYTGGYKFYADGYYFAMQTVTVRTVSRIYDFKVSDCTDLAYKSVFRNVNSPTDVNSLTGNNYYSGLRRMFVYTNNNKEYTTLLDRDDIYINGTSSTKTLPIGPYKHTTATYVKSPKLGYRIAFDLKTTGYYLADPSGTKSRSIKIKPSYYYISKDGSRLERDITLYYQDQSNKYKQFKGSDYTIYFVPNDGYRYKLNSTTSNISSMSTKQESLNIGSQSGEFYLTDRMMSSDDTNYIQSWYGEFKLPNTTIAVKNGDSIDNALTDGYIGVKFDIMCSDLNLNETISYNQNNKSAASQINTTQWDYEGYMGFSNPGQPVTPDSSLRLQLEKGIWSIDSQDVYDFVKGTVVLFDTDSRAADDIQ